MNTYQFFVRFFQQIGMMIRTQIRVRKQEEERIKSGQPFISFILFKERYEERYEH